MLTAGIAAQPSCAQVSASITGLVTDPAAAAVPSAVVTAKNLETGVSRIAATDNSGRYNLPSLPVGVYDVIVSKAGFRDEVRRGIHLAVGQEAPLDFQLSLKGTDVDVFVFD
ncbi:MAG TPA: carboxypeptidase-like regulatory domain-containing protein, partial [Candidatus Acidoferrum sp.]|nr:carboxypeptidase-like regulatory domain-containing protein [Candidatus Acidoferrum sp.]